MTKNTHETFWDGAAKEYATHVDPQIDDARYGAFGHKPGEKELQLLGSLKDKKILVLGFGTGRAVIAFEKAGANCVGIDISSTQVEIAEQNAKEHNCNPTFLKSSFNDLSIFQQDEFDYAFSAYALQYAENLNHVFSQVSHILKPTGRFAFSLDHPDFLAVNQETGLIEKDTPFGKLVIKVPWHSEMPLTIFKHSVKTIEHALESNGFNIMRQIGFHAPELMRLLKDKTGNMIQTPTTAIFQAEKSALRL